MTELLVIGIDGATWSVITPHLNELPNFKKLMGEGRHDTIYLAEDRAVISPAIWTSMFSGVPDSEHGHTAFIKNDEVVERDSVPVKFCWDLLDCDIRALQVPFVMPPYNYNVDYYPVGGGAARAEDELEEDTDGITFEALENLRENPDIFIVVFNALDRIQHFHWGEPMVVAWYKKIDRVIGMLEKYGEKLIIISDHGFCGVEDARVKTLPDVNSLGESLKGDHFEEAIVITRNVEQMITKPEDVFSIIMQEGGKCLKN